MGQMPLHVAQGFIERPDRNVGGALGIQLTHRSLSAGVCPQDPCVGGEASGFTKVAHLRPLVGALLAAAVQLRDRDDGDLELLGQELEGTGELGDLLLAALDAFARAHQLQVVDDHQAKIVLLLEAAALGPDLHERHVRRIINEQWSIGDLGHGPRQPGPVLVAHRALTHVLQLDGRLGRQQSHRDLGATHLEAEEHGSHLVLDCRRPGYIQAPRRFPNSRSRRHDDHLPGVQAVGQVVEVGEPRGDSGHLTGLARGGLDLVDRRLKHIAKDRVVIPATLVRHGVDLGLSGIDDVDDVSAVLAVAHLDDLRAGIDEPPQDRSLGHDLRVVPGVGCRRH